MRVEGIIRQHILDITEKASKVHFSAMVDWFIWSNTSDRIVNAARRTTRTSLDLATRDCISDLKKALT